MIHDKKIAGSINKLMQDINGKLNESISSVQLQCSEEEFKEYRIATAKVMAEILLEVLNPIYKIHPDIMPDELKSDMITEDEIEKLAISKEDTAIIKQHILANIVDNWRKVARVIGDTMIELKSIDQKWNGISDLYYAHLIKELAAAGKISSRGNLDRMRYSEICLKERKESD